eukprot:2112202-Alexandrium_andersonii.AAC.1
MRGGRELSTSADTARRRRSRPGPAQSARGQRRLSGSHRSLGRARVGAATLLGAWGARPVPG